MSDDYEVGYGKPPKQHQFKPGHKKSKGPRRKRRPSLHAIIEKELFEPITYEQGGKKKSMPAVRMIVRKSKIAALNGDEKATLLTMKLAHQYLPSDPEPEGEENQLTETEIAIMNDFLAAKALFAGGDDE